MAFVCNGNCSKTCAFEWFISLLSTLYVFLPAFITIKTFSRLSAMPIMRISCEKNGQIEKKSPAKEMSSIFISTYRNLLERFWHWIEVKRTSGLSDEETKISIRDRNFCVAIGGWWKKLVSRSPVRIFLVLKFKPNYGKSNMSQDKTFRFGFDLWWRGSERKANWELQINFPIFISTCSFNI